MLSVSQVVYKKVEGQLIVALKPLNAMEKKTLPNLQILPCLAFLPSSSGSPPVYIPFISIAKLQSSVSGSKVTLFKFDILPAFTSPNALPTPMLANFIFNFTGPNAEEHRETVKRTLPNFPYVEPLISAPIASGPSKPVQTTEGSNVMEVDQPSNPQTVTPTKPTPSTLQSASPGLASHDSIERSVMSSLSSQTTARQRERRVEKLRKDEKLRLAYLDLVVASPHIFTDEEFWSTYAYEDNGQEDDADVDDSANRENTKNRGNATPTAFSSPPSKNKVVENAPNQARSEAAAIMKSEQVRSIENELTPGTGFLDLLTKNFIDGRLKLVLTPALRKQIYEEYPLVRVAFNARVPAVLTPPAFWDMFFKAQLAKMLRKKAENENSATVGRPKKSKSKSAKSTSAKSSTSVSPTPKLELTKEERETLFFERLTEATPAQLDALVWQSRASDSLSHDPAKSTHTTSRTSLLSYLAEDESTKRAETRHFGTNAQSIYDASTPISTATKGTTNDDDNITVGASSDSDPISQQKAQLKKRIAQLSLSSAVGGEPIHSTKPGTSSQHPSGSSAPGPSGVITAEEMLFSALQEQSSLENSKQGAKKSGKSTGKQSVMATWYGAPAEGGASSTPVDPLSEKPSDAVELLDGIIVEAGELDDSSWTELKREKEKRNRHLQLIRKFNRHGHIVVSSASHASESETSTDSAHGTAPTSDVATSGRSLRIKSSPTKIKDEVHHTLSEAPSASAMEIDVHEPNKQLEPIPFPCMDIDSEPLPTNTATTELQDTFIPRSWEKSKGEGHISKTSMQPSSASLNHVKSQLEHWLETSYKAPQRLRAPIGDLESERKDSMEIDFNDIQGLLEKIDQWKRHFWNVMERISSATSGGGTHLGLKSATAEKLAPIVSKLEDFLDLLREMGSIYVITGSHGTNGMSESSRTVEMRALLNQQKESVLHCLTLHKSLQSRG